MPQNLKRKAMESDFDETDDLLHFYQQRVRLLQLTVAKFRETYGDTRRRKGPDYRKRALLRSAVIRYKKQRQEEDEAEEMAQND